MVKLAIVALGLVVAVDLPDVAFGHAPLGNKCVTKKNLSAAAYFRCRMSVRNRARPATSLDFSACARRLGRSFTRVESRFGYCPSPTSSLGTIQLRVEAADNAVEAIVQPQPPAAPRERQCAIAIRNLVARYVRCEAYERRDVLLGGLPPYQRCWPGFDSQLLDLFDRRSGECGATVLPHFLREASGTARSQLVGANFEGMDLGSADLGFADLEGANFARADIRSANFPSANLERADVSDTDLGSASFAGADLREARLYYVRADGADFVGANLERARFSGAQLRVTNFTDADLSEADFAEAELRTVYFDRAELDGVSFDTTELAYISSVDLPFCPDALPEPWVCVAGMMLGPTASIFAPALDGVSLDAVNLSGAELSGGSFLGASLVGADLSSADISAADFNGADMRNVNLTDAFTFATDLGGANLRGANLTRVDFGVTYIHEADMDGVIWGSTYCADGTRSTDHVPESCCGTFTFYGQPFACSP